MPKEPVRLRPPDLPLRLKWPLATIPAAALALVPPPEGPHGNLD